jgi:hypothetical protein
MISMVRTLVLVFLIFFITYNISFSAFPAASTGRVGFVLLLLLAGKDFFSTLQCQPSSFFLGNTGIAICLVWSVIVYAFVGGDDATQISRLIHFFLYCVIAPLLMVAYSKYDIRAFLFAYGGSALLQSAFIYASFFSSDIRELLSEHLVLLGNYDFFHRFRATGLTNSGGALLSIAQALGVAALLLALRLSSSSLAVTLLTWLAIFFIVTSVFPVARTGLALSLSFIAIYGLSILFRSGFFIYNFARLFLVMAVMLPLTSFLLFNLIDDLYLSYFYDWAKDILNISQSDSYQTFTAMSIPEFDVRTMIGTGMVVTPSGGNASGHDSGYIQAYFALGFFVTLLFYASIAMFFYDYVRGSQFKVVLISGLLIMFLLDIKEPFILKYIEFTFLFSLALFFYFNQPRKQC